MPEPLYVGLMTGTSMDAVDAVVLDTDGRRATVFGTHSAPLPAALRDRLLAINDSSPLAEIMALDASLGDIFAGAVNQLLETTGVTAAQIRAIGSHGQTVWHAPDRVPPGTFQIGDPSRLAQATGIAVVADFRRGDMAAGGQGAPLAPAFHHAFFADPDEDRVVVNIGGMANITCLPERSRPGEITGFDTGPGNVLLDDWHRRHRGGAFDAGGAWAASGDIAPELLAVLRRDPYFRRPPPKSTGRDHFNAEWLAAAGVEAWPAATVQATLAELTAGTIADALHAAVPAADRVLVCGGGARNDDLMARLRTALPGIPVAATDTAGMDAQWVEAAGFAWLAWARLSGRAGNVPAVTGARRPVTLGAVYS
ncbi:anhydro-N-acetylmuramic acid kinase [Aquisalimonas lutea]|uniref:anhydro-N-acetylmuramic acid kinase n=1 Tax=Aquisalimonas lutea TaxID=1327750 RepID=UPI0025B47252|nr:anhydro-N-acetylmuramic acid kinase [Aquisalimonas lutea]MDN3517019.1 anhydro-N-acetylmuramic acid kinase [Aquisalimonas lutea]